MSPQHERNVDQPAVMLPNGRMLPYGNGCSYYADCFTCPFRACRYDAKRGPSKVALEDRQKRVASLAGSMPGAAIAARLGIAERTVYRYLRNSQES